jgi:hypothetical protein
MQRMAAGRRIPARWQALVLVLIALASLVPTRPAAAAPEGESRDTTLQIGESRIEVRFADGEFALGSKRILEWVENSARIVAGYYGRFPVSRVRLQIEPRGGRGIGPGSSYGPGNALVRVGVGQNVAEMQLQRDWILIHEFVHLAFPWLSSEHSWLEEGLATYVEPVARAQGGQMSNEGVWEDLFGGLPKGLPRSGDRGLDRTPTWGRTYWGGALFCLLADVEIRRRTDNRFGLQDALRGVLEHGGSIEVAWPIRKALKAADDAVGVPVLTELYEQMRATPVDTDLEALARKLGIERTGDAIVLDDEAPDAPLRDAITAPVTPTPRRSRRPIWTRAAPALRRFLSAAARHATRCSWSWTIRTRSIVSCVPRPRCTCTSSGTSIRSSGAARAGSDGSSMACRRSAFSIPGRIYRHCSPSWSLPRCSVPGVRATRTPSRRCRAAIGAPGPSRRSRATPCRPCWPAAAWEVRRSQGIHPREGNGDAPAERGDQIRAGDDRGHVQEVRDAQAHVPLAAQPRQHAVDAADRAGGLRDHDVLQRHIRVQRESAPDSRVALPHQTRVALLEEQHLAMASGHPIIESDHELRALHPEQALLAAQVLDDRCVLVTDNPALRALECLRRICGRSCRDRTRRSRASCSRCTTCRDPSSTRRREDARDWIARRRRTTRHAAAFEAAVARACRGPARLEPLAARGMP